MRCQGLCKFAAALVFAVAFSAETGVSASPTTPNCAAGPEASGGTIYGTPCDDRIVAPPGVAAVNGGGGDDTILAAPITAAADCPNECRLGVGSQTFEGGPGNDVVYGERGNDRLFGGAGNDQLFGGIGDDQLKGGPGDDRLSGGFGGDAVDGEADNDYVRGDPTQDNLRDTGGGADTLSYSTGVTPGFPDNAAYPNFSAVPGLPPKGGERGVYLNLTTNQGDNGVAPDGGGVDDVEGSSFETVIGTAYSDYIVGGDKAETIYGGGGGDVIIGGKGSDVLFGGADGDHLDGGEGANTMNGGGDSDHCEGTGGETGCESGINKGGVVVREASKVSVGQIAPEETRFAELYLSGSNLPDSIVATYAPGSVTFSLGPGSGAFDSGGTSSGCNLPGSGQVVCPLSKPLDSVILAGLDGNDSVQTSGFPAPVSIVISGGDGDDKLTGADASEDVLADGPDAGADTLSALGGDDALLNNGGADKLFGGAGNDLFLSDSICDGDMIDGGAGQERDNASWAKFTSGVEAQIGAGRAGKPGAGGEPECASGSLDKLAEIEDLEGTGSADVFYGGPGKNQLLGWDGSDSYFAGAGVDTILANSGDAGDAIDCGDDDDTALIDRAPIIDTAAASCEKVQEADKNNFRVETELPPPPPPPDPEVPLPGSETSLPAPAPGSGGQPKVPPSSSPSFCLPRPVTGLRCGERPRWLDFAPLGRLKGIRWKRWGTRNPVGFGHLKVLKPCCDPNGLAHARVKATAPERCGARRWYTRLTVTYGRGYRKPFARRLLSATPCG
jgi:Ca2+-binding RTX toxin-like protein